MSNFDKSLEVVLHHEGGYVNHPKDPGGETNMGITKRVYERYLGHEVDHLRDLTVDDVRPIYESEYWEKSKSHELPAGLDLSVFDFAVNAGVGRSVKTLQKLVGSHPDGLIGPNTLRSVAEHIEEHGIEKTIHQFAELRETFYRNLSHFDTFGRGWLRRVAEVESESKNMV